MRAASRFRSVAAGLSVAALAMTGLAATAPDGCYAAIEDDPATEDVDETVIACEQATWVADPSGTKAGNLAVTGGTDFPTLVDEEPEESVASPGGAASGAGYLGTSLLQLAEPDVDASGFTIKGQFTGVIDRLALTLHGAHFGYGKLPFPPTGPIPPDDPNPMAPTEQSPMTAYVSLEVDGLGVIPTQTLEIDFTTDDAPTAAASERYRVVLTDLAVELEDWGVDMGPDAVHDITIRVTPRFINTDPVVLFLYGTSEVPSGVVFNPVEPDAEVATSGPTPETAAA